MKKSNLSPIDISQLRAKAEAILREKNRLESESNEALSPEDVQKIRYELRVHQIELEIQSEELRQTQTELEKLRTQYFDLYDQQLRENQNVLPSTMDSKLAEIHLTERERLFRAIFEQVAVGVAITDAHTKRFLRINQKYCDIIGYSQDEVLNLTFLDITHPEDLPTDLDYFQRLLQGEISIFTMEKRYYRKDGTVVWVNLTVSSLWVEGSRSDERRQVAIIEDITERKQMEVALRQSESRLQQAQKILGLGVWDWDIASDITVWSGEMFNIYGITPESFTGKGQDYINFTHPEDRAIQLANIEKSFQRAAHRDDLTVGSDGTRINPEIDPHQFRIIRPDGSICWVEGDAVAVVNQEREPVKMIGVLVDITAQKQVEAQMRVSLHEKEILLQEIHHRVKNNLQIITSLLYIQAQKSKMGELQDVFIESQNRIASMTLIHEKLYQSTDLARISFVEYAYDLVHSLFQSYGIEETKISLSIEASGLTLDINNAVPCGLIINEIISNSLKYAFPHNHQAVIRIALTLDKSYFTLAISDNGIGLPLDFQQRSSISLGTKLIERLVEQIQGTLKRKSSQKGTHYIITFPCEAQYNTYQNFEFHSLNSDSPGIG